MQLYQPTITGSLSVSGSIELSGSLTLAGGGTISGTASIATNAITASSADNFLVRGNLTAQTLVVQTITSSVDFVTGSTRFGSIAANTHVFTGSMSVSGSAIFSSTIRSNDDSGLALGSIAGYRRLQYVLGSTKFSLLTDTNSLANIEANAATFSSTIGTTGDITITKASDASFIANNTSASGKSYRLVSKDDGKFYIQNTGVADLFNIASNGTATFASSISAGTFLGVTRAGANDVGSGPYVVIAQPTSAIQWLMQLNASAGLDYWHYNGSAWSTPLRLASSGAATFSNSVTATKANTFRSSLSVPYNTATLMQVCATDGGQGSMYLIVAAIGGAGTENIAMGILVTIAQGGGTARWAFQNNGAQLTLTDPGSNGYVYVTQTKAGGNETVNYSILRIG